MKKLFSVLLSFSIIFLGAFMTSCACNEEEQEPCAHKYGDGGICVKCGELKPGYKAGVEVTFTDEVEITFYHTMGQDKQAILNNAIARFNEIFPNITVNQSQAAGNYDALRDKIRTELSAGNHPDIAYCYPDHVATYNGSGAVQPLTTYINNKDYIMVEDEDGNPYKYYIGFSDIDIDNFIPGYYAEGAVYGSKTMYNLPFSKSTEVLYYNKDFFTTNGLNVPTHWFSTSNTDTSSMEYVLQAIKTIDPNCIPLGYDSEANWFITMCEQYGSGYTSATGTLYRYDNATNREFVAKFREWYQADLITTQEIYGSYCSNMFKKTAASDKKCYMTIGSTAGATSVRPAQISGTDEYPFEVGIASIPQIDESNPKVISQGPDVCIFKNTDSNKVLASWLLVSFLTTDVTFQAAFSSSGYMPVLKMEVMMTNPVFAEEMENPDGGENIAALAKLVAMQQQDAYYTSPAFVGSSKARTEVGSLLQACLVFDSVEHPDANAYIAELFAASIAECESNS